MKKLTTDEFIEKAKEIHGDKYDYSKVNYENRSTKVCVICPIHGEFWQTPEAHLHKQGCPKCSGNAKLTTEEFIIKAKKRHGDKYDYSKTIYINACTKVCIICPEHGEFWQTPHNHLSGQGCPKCSIELNKEYKRRSVKSFIEEAKAVHGDKYDYSKVKYVNNYTKVCIICPEHGEFWQTPNSHLSGGSGCPMCASSHLEEEIRIFLKEENITFEEQKTWEWLIYESHQYVDFFLPEYNTVIECHGIQHFEAVDYFGGEDGFKYSIDRDQNKLKLCEEHNLKVLYYTTFDNDNVPETVIRTKQELLLKIKGQC